MLSINEQDKINAVRRKLFYAKWVHTVTARNLRPDTCRKLQKWCEKRINEYRSQLRVVGRC